MLYNYKAKVLRVVDGDTIHMDIDLGMRISYKTNCRLDNINTPELTSKDMEVRIRAIAAKEFLINMLPVGSIVDLNSTSLDKYGRPLGIIVFNGGNVNEEMLKNGHAVVYK